MFSPVLLPQVYLRGIAIDYLPGKCDNIIIGLKRVITCAIVLL